MKTGRIFNRGISRLIKYGVVACIGGLLYIHYPVLKKVLVEDDFSGDTKAAKVVNPNLVKLGDDVCEEMLQYPGFFVSFNKEHHIPNYVTWKVTREHIYNPVVKKRTDNFAQDPKVNGCPLPEDYRNSGYDRGHMAPAADMKWSLESMNASFLMTNMAPQKHELNDGPWKHLEEKCRDWAVRDSIILVVCGPILNDGIHHRIGWSNVSVPHRFFKVLLAPYANPPRGIGFIMPNDYVRGGIQACAVSIDEVERATGMDFFYQLSDDVAERLESQCDFNAWFKGDAKRRR